MIMEEASFAGMNWEEQEAYIASMKQKWDDDNSITFAEQKGEQRGMEKGKEKGLELQNLENAKELKRLGVAVDTIAQALHLSEEQVRAL